MKNNEILLTKLKFLIYKHHFFIAKNIEHKLNKKLAYPCSPLFVFEENKILVCPFRFQKGISFTCDLRLRSKFRIQYNIPNTGCLPLLLELLEKIEEEFKF